MNSFLKTPFQVFPYGICELFLRTTFLVHLRTTASLYTPCTHLSLLVILYFPIHLSSRPCNEKPVLIKQTNKKTALIICLNWNHPNIISLQPQKWIKNQGLDMENCKLTQKNLGGSNWPLCGSKNVFSGERMKSCFFVTFNIIISDIFSVFWKFYLLESFRRYEDFLRP